MGINFAKKNFPGHRVIVCAHPDGANGSGNIHVHIVITSVRFEDRAPDNSFMKLQKDGSVKPSEYKAGCKHQDTAKLRHYLTEQVQDYCKEKGYAVIEEKPSKKVTDKEYKIKKEGQKRLDKKNEQKLAEGKEPEQTEFLTKKDDLRKIVSHAASISNSWDEFTNNLRNSYTRKVEVKPELPEIKYKDRQELWAKYKNINTDFWEGHRKKYEVYNTSLTLDFTRLKEHRQLEWQAKNRKNSASERVEAESRLKLGLSSEDLKDRIDDNKEDLEKLKLLKNIYQTYSKAAKIALSNNLEAEARYCIEQMEALQLRHEGYLVDGISPYSRHLDLTSGRLQSKITFRATREEELYDAQKVLQNVEYLKMDRDALMNNPRIEEQDFPVDVKISRGVISFKHPDLERWTRGKSLGADFELDAINKVIENNRERETQKKSKKVEYER